MTLPTRTTPPRSPAAGRPCSEAIPPRVPISRRPTTSHRRSRRWWIAPLALVLSSCVFHDAPAPRYYSPPTELGAVEDPPATHAVAGRVVRLRRVRGAAYLGEQIVWRTSDVERGLYEQRRWTEFPSRYLERSMARALDRSGVRRVAGGRVPTLDLELVSFDEVLAPTHEADVEVLVLLRGSDQETIFDRSFSARRPITGAEPSAVARAMGAALDDVVAQIAAQVAAQVPVPPAKRK